MIASQLQAIQYYTAADPYWYQTDNRPLQNLAANQALIAAYIDKLTNGRVDITGGSAPVTNAIPSGWSVSRTGTGVYVITHNLNLAANSYSVLGSCYSANVFFATALTANSFTANTVNFSGAAVDVQFVCELTQV
jgi:hypothetical protein